MLLFFHCENLNYLIKTLNKTHYYLFKNYLVKCVFVFNIHTNNLLMLHYFVFEYTFFYFSLDMYQFLVRILTDDTFIEIMYHNTFSQKKKMIIITVIIMTFMCTLN